MFNIIIIFFLISGEREKGSGGRIKRKERILYSRWRVGAERRGELKVGGKKTRLKRTFFFRFD